MKLQHLSINTRPLSRGPLSLRFSFTGLGQRRLRLIHSTTGVTITQSWHTNSNLDTKVELDNSFAQGVKAELLNHFSPESGNKGQKLNLYFKQPAFHLRSFLELNPAGNVHAVVDGVVGNQGFLIGGEAGYDVQKAAVTRYAAAIGYSTPLYSAAITATNNLNIFSASYYQKVSSAVEVGAKATMDSKTRQKVGLELASKYRLDPLSFAKVRWLSELAERQVRPGRELTRRI